MIKIILGKNGMNYAAVNYSIENDEKLTSESLINKYSNKVLTKILNSDSKNL
jgi:hypothetical protein